MSIARTLVNKLSDTQKQEIKNFLFKLRNIYYRTQKKSHSREDFQQFLRHNFFLTEGDSVLIHSSMDRLAIWGLNAFEIIKALQSIVGPEGTLVMPTFPTRDSETYLENYKPFNVSRTPSQMGLLTEVFRRMPNVIRSLDPIRPFSALGPKAEEYCSEQHLSLFSYDEKSPLFKVANDKGKMVGLGAPLHNFTFVHTIENVMGSAFPVDIYNDKVFKLEVIDTNKQSLKVEKKIVKNSITKYRNIEKFARNFDKEILHQFKYKFSPYFFCAARSFMDVYINLAKKNITIYPPRFNRN